jgi:branched-chain amino acid transport system permease protein
VNEVQTLVFGLVTGSYLIVATLGFALVSRVEKFLNIAHAELIAIGAFVTYGLTKAGWPLPLAGVVAMVAAAAVAVVFSRLVYWPIRRTSAIVLLITSVGVTYVIHGGIESLIEPGAHSYAIGAPAQVDAGLFRIGVYEIAIVVLAALSVLAVHLLLTRTSIGLQWRALSSDESLANGRGIDVRGASLRLWLLVGALGGLAGVLLGLQGSLSTDISFAQILLILSVSILAGLGSIYGVVAAALILGVAMDMSTLVVPAGYREAIAFGVVLLALIVRPQGLSGTGLQRRDA